MPPSPFAQTILEELRSHTSSSSWVFQSPLKTQAPIHWVRKAALRLTKSTGLVFTPHDLRRTAASHMTGMGISRLVVARILNHVERGITAVYDRHSYDAEKKQALNRWADRVAELAGRSGSTSPNAEG